MSMLKKPYITAKSIKLNKANKYCFIVDSKANKTEIKKIVERLYSVSIEKVNTVVYAGKKINRRTRKGFIQGQRSHYKKAILTLSKGSSITMQ